MGTETQIPESHKASFLLARLSNCAQLESTAAALRFKDIRDVVWDAVALDLFQEASDITVGMKRSTSTTRTAKKG